MLSSVLRDKSIHSIFPFSLIIAGLFLPDCSHPRCIQEGYEMMERGVEYQQFRKHMPFIDGTWDDHDYGVNDGGMEYQYKEESQTLFLDFLGIPQDSIRRKRRGVYSSRLFPLYNVTDQSQKEPIKYVKLILLDTRSHREQPYLRSLSEDALIPHASILTAAMRILTTLIGYGAVDINSHI